MEAARIPRDDSPILRLMGADREKTIKPRQPISELITRFEGGVEIPPPPPRPAEPAPRVALESALESATNMADPTPTPNPEPEPVVEEEPLPKSDETLAREEEARRKLADIAREVTSKISSAPAAAKPAAPETPTAPNAAPAKPAEDGDKAKGKIATKTLAELYASQGDWNRAVEVYEALLEKFPTNEAYKKRLEALKAKQAGG